MSKQKKIHNTLIRQMTIAMPQIAARCPYFGTCGGCFLQNIDYEHQMLVKQQLLQKMFDTALVHVDIPCPVSSPEQWMYRNRMDFPIGETGEVGLKAEGRWRDVLDLSVCFLQSETSVKIMQEVREWLVCNNIKGWNATRQCGYARYVVIREGKNTNERMVMLVTHLDTSAIAVDLPYAYADLVTRLKPYVTSLYHVINPRVTDVSFGDEMRLLYGQEFLRETVHGITFFISPFSFFQTNTHSAGQLQTYVVDIVSSSKRILDLYCGSGFFSLPLARKGLSVVGVELDVASIDMAKKNARENNIHGVEFIAIDAKDVCATLVCGQYDTILVDPPRAGLHPKVIEALLRARPSELLYVSCNPAQLLKELPQLLTRYRIKSLQTFDMFPQTPHVEIVIHLIAI